MMKNFYLIFAAALATVFWQAPASGATSVLKTPHNLSASGPGAITAATEGNACIFCHAPHGAVSKTPLWNRNSSAATYKTYASSTTKATIGQPTGSSKLCLSCHDGTVALGQVRGRAKPIAMKNNVTTMPKGPANLGTDLSGDHPISFIFDANLAASDAELKNPAGLVGRARLDSTKQMQCTSCHDPHDNQFGNFLVQNNQGSALCLNCHSLNSWSSSAHALSTAIWNGQGRNPWPGSQYKTVADNGCDNCHASHQAGTPQRLLNVPNMEKSCFVCHSGTVAKQDLRAEFTKISVHPVDLTANLHDPAEDLINGPRHTACADCHNPHATKPAAKGVPVSASPLAGVKGMNVAGAVVNPITAGYELCFRCHADSANRGPALVVRQTPQTNKRLQFAPSNASFHPLESPGKNPSVPSLIAPMNASSMISCTDCHNNDRGPGAGGSGPRGPHGSIYVPLLERQQVLTDFQPESAAGYALCYKCHSRASILANQSFPGHSSHIVNDQTACTTCHDSHGVTANPGLINFNSAYVTAGPGGRISYTSAGPNGGNCTLTCHGFVHNNSSYSIPAQQLARRRVKH